VTDTGRGIAAAQQERIFEPFVQVARGYTSPDEGTGLGLAISRDLARGMGGDLRVRSTPGEGSAFTITLRCAPPAPPAAAAALTSGGGCREPSGGGHPRPTGAHRSPGPRRGLAG
jgi:hypothetical protein